MTGARPLSLTLLIQPVNNWRSYLPLLGVLRRYHRDDFSHDLMAGLVVGMITVPQAIAYAFLAGLPPAAGLYACLLPMVVYAAFGSSTQLVVGPVAVAALMVAGAVAEHGTPALPASEIALILAVQAGIVLLLLRVSNMGGIVNLLSHPVIVGFVNAAALLIVVSQLSALTGIAGAGPQSPLDTLVDLGARRDELDGPTLLLGLACLTGLALVRLGALPAVRLWTALGNATLRRDTPKPLPESTSLSRGGPLLVTVAATLAVAVFDLDLGAGIAVVGQVPAGLPSPTLPYFAPALWWDLLPTGAMIALVSYVESYSIGTTLATRKRTRINGNQELIALGAANVSAAFSGAYPVAGSFSRSSVNYQSGGRTPVSSLVCAVVIVVTLLVATPLFSRLPHAALAAIVMVSVLGLIDVGSLRSHWRTHRHDAITSFATLVTVLAFGIEAGLMTGVALSIAFFIRTSSKPNIELLGRVPNSEHFRSVHRHEVETNAEVAAVRVDENLYFANANQVENKLLKLVQRRSGTRHLLLVCSSVNMVDVSGLEMLFRLNQSLQQMGIQLHLTEVKHAVMKQLQTTELPETLSGRIFFTTDQAMRELTAPAEVADGASH